MSTQAYAPKIPSGVGAYTLRRKKKKKVKPWIQEWLIAARAYPGFCSMKRLGVFLLPLDGMLVHHRSLPSNLLGFPNNLPVPIYTPGWREALREQSVLPKNTTQCPRPGLEPGPLDLETSTLTMRPSRPPHNLTITFSKIAVHTTPFAVHLEKIGIHLH